MLVCDHAAPLHPSKQRPLQAPGISALALEVLEVSQDPRGLSLLGRDLSGQVLFFHIISPPAVPTDLNPRLQILATTIGDQLWVCSDPDLLHPPSLSKVTSDKNLAPVFTGSCARAHNSSHLPRSLCWIHGMNNWELAISWEQPWVSQYGLWWLWEHWSYRQISTSSLLVYDKRTWQQCLVAGY